MDTDKKVDSRACDSANAESADCHATAGAVSRNDKENTQASSDSKVFTRNTGMPQSSDSTNAARRQDFAIFDENTTNLSELTKDSRINSQNLNESQAAGFSKETSLRDDFWGFQGGGKEVTLAVMTAAAAESTKSAFDSHAAGGRIYDEKVGLCSGEQGDKTDGLSTQRATNSLLFRVKPTPTTQNIPLIDLHAQYHAYKHELDSAIASVLHSQHFILGEHSQALERELASFVGRRFCITCSSGTSALLLALLALDIGAGDEVITPSFSFIAAAEMVAFLGAKPVFVDICPSTYTLDIAQVKRAITPRTRAIIPVCLFGLPYDVSGLESLARIHAIPIIEDGAQSFGAAIVNPSGEQAERRSGSFGDLSITSFFPAKPLGGYGDGGAVFCDDENLAQRLRTLRNHGQTSKYRHTTLGLNTRLDELQCAILRVKLRHFPKELEARQNLARRYFALLTKDSRLDSSRTDSRAPESSLSKSSTPDSRLCLPHIPKGRRSSFAQFCLQAQSTESREQILLTLACHGIATAIHYPAPLHLQEAFAYLGYKRGDFPVSESVSERIFSIPLCAFLSPSAQEQIAKVLCRF